MYVKEKYWFFSPIHGDGLSEEQTNRIIQLGKQKQNMTGAVGSLEPGFEGVVEKTTRDSTVSWINDDEIFDMIHPFIERANMDAGWNFQLDWSHDAQFTTYKKNQFYRWHIDQEPNGNEDGKYRKVSATIQLSDPSEYEGGILEFKYFEQGTSEVEIIQLMPDAAAKGSIIVFPSFIHHQVTPVTRGTRMSLVNWTVGDFWI